MKKGPQPNRATLAYALVALAVWAMVAYDLIVPKPHAVWTMAAAKQACVN